MELHPKEAAQKLTENVQKISDMTDKIIEARTAVAMIEANYLDAKAGSRAKAAGMSATATEQYIAQNTVEEKKDLLLAETKLKNYQDLLNVLETSNNNFKMAIKLMELEIKNLNLQ